MLGGTSTCSGNNPSGSPHERLKGGGSSESDSSSEGPPSHRCLVERSDIPIRSGSSSSSSFSQQQSSTSCPSVGAKSPPKTDQTYRLGSLMVSSLSFAMIPHVAGHPFRSPHSYVVTSLTPLFVCIKISSIDLRGPPVSYMGLVPICPRQLGKMGLCPV
jgi:hypothetical protein